MRRGDTLDRIEHDNLKLYLFKFIPTILDYDMLSKLVLFHRQYRARLEIVLVLEGF